jgi:hypothetical protein
LKLTSQTAAGDLASSHGKRLIPGVVNKEDDTGSKLMQAKMNKKHIEKEHQVLLSRIKYLEVFKRNSF